MQPMRADGNLKGGEVGDTKLIMYQDLTFPFCYLSHHIVSRASSRSALYACMHLS